MGKVADEEDGEVADEAAGPAAGWGGGNGGGGACRRHFRRGMFMVSFIVKTLLSPNVRNLITRVDVALLVSVNLVVSMTLIVLKLVQYSA